MRIRRALPLVILAPRRFRRAPPLRRFTELSLRSLVVLAYSEVSSNVEVVTRNTVEDSQA